MRKRSQTAVMHRQKGVTTAFRLKVNGNYTDTVHAAVRTASRAGHEL